MLLPLMLKSCANSQAVMRIGARSESSRVTSDSASTSSRLLRMPISWRLSASGFACVTETRPRSPVASASLRPAPLPLRRRPLRSSGSTSTAAVSAGGGLRLDASIPTFLCPYARVSLRAAGTRRQRFPYLPRFPGEAAPVPPLSRLGTPRFPLGPPPSPGGYLFLPARVPPPPRLGTPPLPHRPAHARQARDPPGPLIRNPKDH